jgi:hypothetical protein
MRTLISTAVAFVLFAGAGLADDAAKGKGKAKGQKYSGTIKKIDAATNTITVSVKAKGAEAKDMEFKVGDDAKVLVYNGDAKPQQLSGKDALKNEKVKEGVKVTVGTDDAGKVTQVTIGEAPKKKKADSK